MAAVNFRLFLIGLTLFVLPTAAAAQNCTSAGFTSNFGPVTVDIVPGSTTASAVAQFRTTCTTGSQQVVRHCQYIAATGATVRDEGTFYLIAGTDSRLAWRMTGGFPGGVAASTKIDGSTAQTSGQGCGSSGPAGSNCNNSYNMTITFLPRSSQDRVRPGAYTTVYTMKTYYWQGGTANFCHPVPAGSPFVTSNFSLTANVLKACQLENITNVDFGSRGSVVAANTAGSANQANASLSVRCTFETAYSVALDNGQNFDGAVRRMRSGTNYLAYQLFQAGCLTPWDSGSSVVAGTGNAVNVVNTHAVCARLVSPVASAPPTGTCTDTVVVTLTF